MKKKHSNNKIISLSFMITIVFFVIISIKLIYVAISPTVDGIDLKTFALSRTTANKTITANRGTIYDVNGDILAQNARSYTVIAYLEESRTTDIDNPRHVIDKNMTAKVLSPLINMKEETILKLLNQDLYQVELGPGGRNISELLKQEIEKLDLPGIDFIKSTKRDYPNGDFASYIIGYAKKDDNDNIVGELGIEGKYNSELTGKNGKIIYQKDAYGYKIANTKEVKEDATDGLDIYLTLDSNIQMYLENAVDEIEGFGADWSTITIADASTGAIVGSASSPSYNPNKLDIKNYNSPLVSYTYEPGSTMKIFSFMAAMEEGKYSGSSTYKSGTINVDEYKIKDWNNVGWGTITYDTGFTYSSNVAAVKLAKSIGKAKLLDYYEAFGFGKKTGIELSNEYTGKLDFFYESELASASYGQGITTTPIQNIEALTSLTNNGTIIKPYIVSKIVNSKTGEVVYEGKRKEIRKVVSEATVNKMIELMDLTVNGSDNNATGKKYQTDKVRLIGKTGTANYTVNGKYATGTYSNIKSFAGIFPKENPKYIIYISIKKFQSSSGNLGTIVKKMVESVAKYKNLSSYDSKEDTSKMVKIKNYVNKSREEVINDLMSFGLNPIVIGNGEFIIKQYPNKEMVSLLGSRVFLLTNDNSYFFPDVTGYTRSEITCLLNMMGVKYNINGYGNVISTSINKGDLLDRGATIEINLGG